MIHDEPDDIHWADSLDDFKTEGYIPIKCWSVLQFYTLRGRTTTLIKENLIYSLYTYYCVYSPSDKRYYKRMGHKYSLDETFFYQGDDIAILNLMRFIEDKNLTILMSQQQVESVSECLKRLYKAYFNTEGKLDYRLYIKILELSLKLEDFHDNQKGVQGYKTVINQMETQIRELWEKGLTPKKGIIK